MRKTNRTFVVQWNFEKHFFFQIASKYHANIEQILNTKCTVSIKWPGLYSYFSCYKYVIDTFLEPLKFVFFHSTLMEMIYYVDENLLLIMVSIQERFVIKIYFLL